MASLLSPERAPLPDYSGASAFLPIFAAPLDATLPFLLLTGGVLALSAATVRFAAHAVYRSTVGFTIVVMGAVIVPAGLQESFLTWAGAALLGVAVISTVVHFSARVPALVPLILGTLAVTDALETALMAPYRGARVGGLLAAALIAWLALTWSRALSRADGVPQDVRAERR